MCCIAHRRLTYKRTCFKNCQLTETILWYHKVPLDAQNTHVQENTGFQNFTSVNVIYPYHKTF